MAQAELPRHTQLYGQLSEEQQDALGKAVIEKLRTLIGGYGELSVLAEYIAVMLQSNRPADMIQTELEAFLQEQSKPFTRWLTKEIEKHGRAAGADANPDADPGSEVLLNRITREAHGRKSGVKVENTKEKKQRKERRSSRHAPEAAELAAPAPVIKPKERRSRSRRRRRDKEAARAGFAPAPPGAAGENDNGADRKVTLTPNVQFLRDAYHNKVEDPADQAMHQELLDPGSPSKWHFRAEPLGPLSAPPQASAGPPGVHHLPGEYGYPPHLQPHPGMAGAAAPAPPPRQFKTIAPKKWKVVRANTIVRETEQLNSAEVRSLHEGEIVEQVSPSMTLQGGIVRLLIRHPSTPQFPAPIGWVTLDATAAGGPKFLEPGPEPMSRGLPWAPPVGTKAAAALSPAGAAPAGAAAAAPAPWAAPAPAYIQPVKAAPAPVAAKGPKGYQNLVWTPGG